MELNKRKSLLTPAAATVWGMIYGDIDKQKDIVDMIGDKVGDAIKSFMNDELISQIKEEVIEDITPLLNEQYQPMLVSGYNIKTLKGRDVLGEGDIDPLDEGDRMLLDTIDTKADASSVYTKRQVDDLISNVEVDTTNLATKEELNGLRDGDVWKALYNSSEAKNVAYSTIDTVNELRTYVDEQLGGIDTITDEILG